MTKKPKPKEPGRPAGAPNKGSSFTRDYFTKYRVTEGYKETIRALQQQDPGKKLSEADIMHECLQLYAIRKLYNKTDLYYVNRII